MPMSHCVVALKSRFQNGMVVAWHGRGMACVNQTQPHCVNQMGKTHSKYLAARYGRGTAWARHGMCELAFNVTLFACGMPFRFTHTSSQCWWWLRHNCCFLKHDIIPVSKLVVALVIVMISTFNDVFMRAVCSMTQAVMTLWWQVLHWQS
jgi:hypothetical protein